MDAGGRVATRLAADIEFDGDFGKLKLIGNALIKNAGRSCRKLRSFVKRTIVGGLVATWVA